jgi:hypothetical protein
VLFGTNTESGEELWCDAEALSGTKAGATIWGMTVKERVIKLIDSLPDTPESERWLKSIAKDLSSTEDSNVALDPVEDDSEPTFEEGLRKLAETFAGMDFLPREEAWR